MNDRPNERTTREQTSQAAKKGARGGEKVCDCLQTHRFCQPVVWCCYELFPAIFIESRSQETERKQWVLPLFSLRCHVVSYRIVVIVHRLCSCVRFYTNNSTSRAIIFRWNNSCGWLEILSHSVKTFKRFIRFTCFEWVQKFLRVFLVSISFVACVWSFWFIFCKGFSFSFWLWLWLCLSFTFTHYTLFPQLSRSYFVSFRVHLFSSQCHLAFGCRAFAIRNFHAYGFSIERQ